MHTAVTYKRRVEFIRPKGIQFIWEPFIGNTHNKGWACVEILQASLRPAEILATAAAIIFYLRLCMENTAMTSLLEHLSYYYQYYQ